MGGQVQTAWLPVICRKDPEWLPATPTNSAEVAFVEGQQVDDVVPFREDDKRSVGQPEVEVGVLVLDLVRPGDVADVERFELVDAVRHLSKERSRRISRDTRREEVIKFSEDELPTVAERRMY